MDADSRIVLSQERACRRLDATGLVPRGGNDREAWKGIAREWRIGLIQAADAQIPQRVERTGPQPEDGRERRKDGPGRLTHRPHAHSLRGCATRLDPFKRSRPARLRW